MESDLDSDLDSDFFSDFDSDFVSALLSELEAVTAELRRRVGQSFTLAELADAYASAEVWSREAVEETEPASGWPRRLSTVTDAAFHLYSRGAVDYEP